MILPTYAQLEARYKALGFAWPEFHLVAVRSKANKQNKFDDLIGFVDSITQRVVWSTGTTNSGDKPLLAPTHPDGVAIVVADQQVIDGWGFHYHKGKYLCLGQKKKVKYQRDNDKDAIHESQGKVYDDIRGFNWHRANEKAQSENVENWSEGCPVQNNPKNFDFFMAAAIMHYEITTGKKLNKQSLPTDFFFTGTFLNEWLEEGGRIYSINTPD